jgi:hypothetical protein
MKASDIDEDASLPQRPTAHDWLRVVGAAIAIILVCVLWTFWA